MSLEIGPDEEADASAGGTGAPPPPHSANRVFARLTREYSSESIRVQWYARRCIHSAACIRALPQVFDPARRPWVLPDAASADAIADAVLKCPTGALQFVRLDGGPGEIPPDTVRITAVKDGPYFVRGPVEIRDEHGDVIRTDTRFALCRCGQSKHLPFCDNTHRAIGFRSGPSEP
jgi:uncharacterized Fe-S cluster protein YjdI/CDGSH-type Zn-finger protein